MLNNVFKAEHGAIEENKKGIWVTFCVFFVTWEVSRSKMWKLSDVRAGFLFIAGNR